MAVAPFDDGVDDVFIHGEQSVDRDGLQQGNTVSYDTEYVRKCKASNCTVTSSGGGGGGGWSGVEWSGRGRSTGIRANSAPRTTGAGCSRGARNPGGGIHATVCSARLLRQFQFFFCELCPARKELDPSPSQSRL